MGRGDGDMGDAVHFYQQVYNPSRAGKSSAPGLDPSLDLVVHVEEESWNNAMQL